MKLPELLTPEEMAEMLKISKAGVYRLTNGRKIPFHKVGGSIRFDKEDILKYLEQNKIESIK